MFCCENHPRNGATFAELTGHICWLYCKNPTPHRANFGEMTGHKSCFSKTPTTQCNLRRNDRPQKLCWESYTEQLCKDDRPQKLRHRNNPQHEFLLNDRQQKLHHKNYKSHGTTFLRQQYTKSFGCNGEMFVVPNFKA